MSTSTPRTGCCNCFQFSLSFVQTNPYLDEDGDKWQAYLKRAGSVGQK